MAIAKETPTLEDVARRAGVSTATVSRCLNTPERVIDATRRKVLDVVADLGYSPNFGARVMAARRTNTIGAIIPTMENAIFARGLQAFQEELRDLGFTLLVASSSYRQDLEEEQIRALVARGADALLLIGNDRDRSIDQFLDAQGIPALITWFFEKGTKHPCVGFDNRSAMRALARKVVEMGHTKIGMISAGIATNDRARARVAGVTDAMAEAGLDRAALRIVETTYGIETGAQAFAGLFKNGIAPTAVMCGNDVLAVGALLQAREMGISVPDEVSITGFDDIEIAQVAYPALTTVHVPHREMGRTAAQTLVRMLHGETTDLTTELQAKIRMRASLATVAKNGDR